jgi:hypothetical protein
MKFKLINNFLNRVMRKIVMLAILLLALLPSTLVAQDLLKSTDLSTLKVDYLSDSDIIKIKAQLLSNNLTVG